jgi:hypothetical protein
MWLIGIPFECAGECEMTMSSHRRRIGAENDENHDDRRANTDNKQFQENTGIRHAYYDPVDIPRS